MEMITNDSNDPSKQDGEPIDDTAIFNIPTASQNDEYQGSNESSAAAKAAQISIHNGGTRSAFVAISRKTLSLVLLSSWRFFFLFYVLPLTLTFLLGIARLGLPNDPVLGVGDLKHLPSSVNPFINIGKRLVWADEANGTFPGGVRQLVTAVAKDSSLSVMQASSHSQLLSICTVNPNSLAKDTDCFAGLTFWQTESPDRVVNYTLTFPANAIGYAPDAGGLGPMGNEGYLSVMLALEKAAMVARSPAMASSLLDWNVYTLPFSPLKQSDFNSIYYSYFYDYVSKTGAAATVFIFCPQVFWLVHAIVAETESRMKEMLFISGLPPVIYFASYLTVSTAILVPSWILVAAMLWGLLFPASDFVCLFVLILITGAELLSLSMLLVSFFTRARLAGATACAVTFAYAAIGLAVSQPGFNGAVGQAIVALLFAPSGLVIGISTLTRAEKLAQGLFPSDWMTAGSDGSLSFGGLLIIMTINIFINLCVAYYASQVIPGSYGVAKPWHFPCQRSGKVKKSWIVTSACDSNDTDDEGTAVASDFRGIIYEPRTVDSDSQSDSTAVRIRGLTKEYASKVNSSMQAMTNNNNANDVRLDLGSDVGVRKSPPPPALAGISLDLWRNDVLALLGRNGCGKSTTLGILTGLLPATSGTATFSVSGEELCLEKDISRIRRYIGFCPQHDVLWPELTVMDHLRLFAAVKVGLTPERAEEEARDWAARVGLTEKEDVCVCHLSGGQKRRLSVAIAFLGGSEVIYLDEMSSGVDPLARRGLWDVVQAQSPGRAILLTTHFIEEAEVMGNRIALLSHGRLLALGTPSFLRERLGRGYRLIYSLQRDRVSEGKDFVDNAIRSLVPEAETLSGQGDSFVVSLPNSSASDTILPELLRLLEKSGRVAGVESFGVSGASLEDAFLEIVGADERLLEEDNNAILPATTLEPSEASHLPLEQLSATTIPEKPSIIRRLPVLLRKRALTSYREPWMAVLPAVVVIVVSGLVGGKYNHLTFAPCPISSVAVSPATTIKMSGTSALPPFGPLGLLDSLPPTLHLPLPSQFVKIASGSLADFRISLQENAKFIFGGLSLYPTSSGTSPSWPWPSAILAANSQILYAGAGVLNLLTNTLYKDALGGNGNGNGNGNVNISPIVASLQPFPVLLTETGGDDWTPFFTFLFVVLLGWSLLIPLLSTMPVSREVKSGTMSAQRVTGVSAFEYWISHLIYDSICVAPLALMLSAALVIGVRDGWKPDFGLTFLLFWLCGVASIEIGYLSTFVVSGPATALAVVTAYLFLPAVGIFTAIMTQLGAGPGQDFIIDTVSYAGMAIDPVAGLLVAVLSGTNIVHLSCGKGNSMWAWGQLGRVVVFLGAQCVLLFLALLAVEAIKDLPFAYKAATAKNVQVQVQGQGDGRNECTTEDEDVTMEKLAASEAFAASLTSSRVDCGERSLMHGFVMSGVRKIYEAGLGVAAVEGLSLVVPRGEVFVLLGANGAGKTTALRILTGQETPTSGDILVNGVSLSADPQGVRAVVGVCAQFDVLFHALTPREHLMLFASLRGMTKENARIECEWLLQKVDLGLAADLPAKSLSGGNQRKLSLALACVGCPPVVVCDEPSTGMDPVSKRALWKLIRGMRERHAVILTTHSLEEAEAVADRVGIMAAGKLVAIGSVSHIKARFGGSVVLDAEAPSPQAAKKLEDMTMSSFPGSKREMIHGSHISIRILGGIQMLAPVFEFAARVQKQGELVSFRVAQSTLERIFLELVAAAGERPMPDRSEDSNHGRGVGTYWQIPCEMFTWKAFFFITVVAPFWAFLWSGLVFAFTFASLACVIVPPLAGYFAGVALAVMRRACTRERLEMTKFCLLKIQEIDYAGNETAEELQLQTESAHDCLTYIFGRNFAILFRHTQRRRELMYFIFVKPAAAIAGVCTTCVAVAMCVFLPPSGCLLARRVAVWQRGFAERMLWGAKQPGNDM